MPATAYPKQAAGVANTRSRLIARRRPPDVDLVIAVLLADLRHPTPGALVVRGAHFKVAVQRRVSGWVADTDAQVAILGAAPLGSSPSPAAVRLSLPFRLILRPPDPSSQVIVHPVWLVAPSHQLSGASARTSPG